MIGESDRLDLDSLMQELQAEADRRRRDPAFPWAVEVRLAEESDRQAPGYALTAGRSTIERVARRIAPPVLRPLAIRFRSVLPSPRPPRHLRIEALPGRQVHPGRAPTAGPGPEADRLAGELAARGGRVLVIGLGARPWVDRLRGGGRDVFGLDPGLAAYEDDGDVRGGNPLRLLGSIDDGALTSVVLLSPETWCDRPEAEALAAAANRVAGAVVFAGGSVPEAWSAALRRAGFGPDQASPDRAAGDGVHWWVRVEPRLPEPDAMKLGLVVPRYGEEVVGGTEHWLRSLCEHLTVDKGWEVEVFTTCAVDAATWADEYPDATSLVNGVTVHRHRSVSIRNPEYLDMYPEVRAQGRRLDPETADRFVELVGPVCPAAVDQAVASDCDLVAVTPYLYWPTLAAVPRLGRRVIFHGAAHDEPELQLPQMPGLYRSVGGFAFNSFAERDLVEANFRISHLPASIIGNAVSEGSGDPAAARVALGLGPDERFVLCVGKVERSKSSHVLAEMWTTYRERRPGAPRLVFVGPVNDEVTAGDGVVWAGRQSEEVKWGALAACEFLIAPSAWESFSLVILEAWLSGRTVMVNARCQPTVEHCRRSAGGIWFAEYGDFEVGADRLLGDAGLRQNLAGHGEEYARRMFAWPAILDRYEHLAARILAAAPLG